MKRLVLCAACLLITLAMCACGNSSYNIGGKYLVSTETFIEILRPELSEELPFLTRTSLTDVERQKAHTLLQSLTNPVETEQREMEDMNLPAVIINTMEFGRVEFYLEIETKKVLTLEHFPERDTWVITRYDVDLESYKDVASSLFSITVE